MKKEPIYSEHAILISKKKYNNALIADFITSKHGLLKAKIWRNNSSEVLDFFALIQSDFIPQYKKQGTQYELYTSCNSNIKTVLKNIPNNLENYKYACFMLELVNSIFRENIKDEVSHKSFRLLWSGLKQLDGDVPNPAITALQFAMRLLYINGFGYTLETYAKKYNLNVQQILQCWMNNMKTTCNLDEFDAENKVKSFCTNVLEKRFKSLN